MIKVKKNISLVIITANSYRHRYLVNRLTREFNVLGVVSEVKRPLVKGETQEENNVIAEHGREREEKEKEYFGAEKEFNLPASQVKQVEYQGANTPEIFKWINSLKPDYVILFGSSIIREPLLSTYENRIINIHLGLSPHYRGSATTFWPLVEAEPECVGVTVHLAVQKVDAGSILGQIRPSLEVTDGPHDIGNKNIIVGTQLLVSCVKRYAAGKIAPQLQHVGIGKVFKGSDFSAAAVLKMKENFKKGVIKEYLARKDERDRKYPIISLMRSIFLFVPPALASDIFATPFLRWLANRFQVVVFTKQIDNETGQRQYLSSPNVTYVKWRTTNARLLGKFKFWRIDGIHQFNHLRGVSQYFEKQLFLRDKWARLIRALARPFGRLLTVDFFTAVEKILIRIPARFYELVREYNPSLIVVSTPGMTVFEAEAILLAKKLGLKTVAINFNWDNLMLQKAHLLRRPDYLLVWNKVIYEQAVNTHRFPAESVFITGVLRFDHYVARQKSEPSREEFLRSKGLDPKLATILFVTESRSYSFQLRWLEGLFELRRDGKIPFSNIFIRVHPHDNPESYKGFLDEPNTHIELAGKRTGYDPSRIEMDKDDLQNQKLTLKHTDINFNYCSTMGLESMIFDRPVVTFYEPGHRDPEKTHYRPLWEHGAVKIVYSFDRLAESINEYLKNPAKDSEKRRYILERYIPFRDGRTAERSVEILEKITSNQ